VEEACCVKRECDSCGTAFEAKRAHARWCSARCSKRGQRGALRLPDPVTVVDVEPVLVASVRADLVEAGVVDTPIGLQALHVAARMSGATADTGSSYAALSRELSRLLAEANVGALTKADPLDELQRRRAAKVASA
jgi:hypothetical protein